MIRSGSSSAYTFTPISSGPGAINGPMQSFFPHQMSTCFWPPPTDAEDATRQSILEMIWPPDVKGCKVAQHARRGSMQLLSVMASQRPRAAPQPSQITRSTAVLYSRPRRGTIAEAAPGNPPSPGPPDPA